MARTIADARLVRRGALGGIVLVAIALVVVIIMQFLGARTLAEQGAAFPILSEVSAAEWERLAARRIYFGHRSVGNNIIDGVHDVMKANPQIKLSIVESSRAAELGAAAFAHSRIGKNKDPKSKIDDYYGIMTGGLGDWCGLALMKLCYIDIEAQTDVAVLFRYYRERIEEVRDAHPELTIVHATIPLLRRDDGLISAGKSMAKRLLGKPRRDASANATRTRFNELLVETYSGMDPIFDIARIESSRADGTRFYSLQGDTKVYAMLPEYTDDGGHLNQRGRTFAAEQLLILLAQSGN